MIEEEMEAMIHNVQSATIQFQNKVCQNEDVYT